MRRRALLMISLAAAFFLFLPSGRLAVWPPPAAAQEPVKLDLWIFEGEEHLLPALKEAFEAEHPHVTVEITMVPEDQYVVKIDTAMAAGAGPDIGFLYDQRWAKAGRILPLEETFAKHGIDLDDFNQAVMAGWCFADGHVYCMGSYTGATVLFYNKAMFDAAGLAYPSPTEPLTIDEYAELAAKLTVPSEDTSQQVWGGLAEAPHWWMDPRTAFSEDGRQTLGYVNDDATKHAYEVLANMVIQGHSPSGSIMQAMSLEGSSDLFLQGKLAMVIGYSPDIETYEAAGLEFGVAPVPVEKAGDPVHVPVWTDGFAVFSGSDNPQEAAEFIAFIGDEGQRLRVEVTGDPPLSARVAEETGWAELGDVEARQEFLQVVRAAEPGIFVPNWVDVALPMEDAFNQIVGGEITAAEVLDAIAPRMQQSLDQAWETWESFEG